ncbi:MAG: hypothetical protein NZ455_07050 [Bacteroidia bacterium]|nr:hypothetical protein [Bacteroidia bacterium]MDW8345400.1 hypothetical protein [Bacteroidia bacterium]
MLKQKYAILYNLLAYSSLFFWRVLVGMSACETSARTRQKTINIFMVFYSIRSNFLD